MEVETTGDRLESFLEILGRSLQLIEHRQGRRR
jgi:hypothetical protein